MTNSTGTKNIGYLFESQPHKFRAPICREYIPVVDPTEFRTRVENAIDNLVALSDAIDAPREDYEAHADERELEPDQEHVV